MRMKAYYEYEDGTFWAIRTEGNSCFTANGSKYCDFYIDIMLNADREEEDLTQRRRGAKDAEGRGKKIAACGFGADVFMITSPSRFPCSSANH